jgi:hypothetical protein
MGNVIGSPGAADLDALSISLADADDVCDIGPSSERDRRASPRLTAREISWLSTVRLKYGPPVSLIDLSVRGALLETDLQLRPGSESVLELMGDGKHAIVPFRVLRCQVADLADGLRYRGALAFKRPMELSDLQPSLVVPNPDDLPADSPNGWHRIIVRYLDGNLLKGYTQDFHPARMHFHIWPSMAAVASERMMVPLPQLKAVFFVRDFAGNATYVEQKVFDQARHGRKIEVTFVDREVIVGSTLNYRPDGQGFFLLPADRQSNNIRLFVVSGSVRHVRFP